MPLNPKLVRIQGVHAFKNMGGNVTGIDIRPPVNVSPFTLSLRPDNHLKALQEPIIASPTRQSPGYIVLKFTGLSAAKNGKAEGFDMERSPAYPVAGESPGTVPCFKEKLPITFPACPVHVAEPPNKLVALK